MASWAGAPRPVAGKGLGKGGVAAPALVQKATTEVVRVYCTNDRDEIGIRTLVGEYREEGANHGRKFYKKTQKIPGHEEINVFLYFWDERDGASFSGWWFGNQVGGAQVWSRNAQASQKPPQSGWTIPWDGDVKEELVVELVGGTVQAQQQSAAQAKKEERSKQELAKQGEVLAAEWEERVDQNQTKAAEVETDVNEALEMARSLLQSDFDDHQLLDAQRELASQSTKLAQLQRHLAMEGLAAQKAPQVQKTEMTALSQRMRELQNTLKQELQNVKDGKVNKAKLAEDEERRVEDEARERELEEGYAKQLEDMLPPAMEKTDAAEDEVEKVAIAAAPLQIDTADDLRPVMLQAIKETEQRVRSAQAAIGEARRYISGKLQMVGRFAPNAKKTAVEEFTSLQDRLKECQDKLNPYKNLRQEYEQRSQMKKLYEELSNKVSGAEIEVEKAAMMTAPLAGDSTEGVKETEQALSVAQSALSQTMRMIDAKLRGLEKSTGPIKDDIRSIQTRAKAAQEKLDEVRRAIKESQVRVAADNLLKEVSEKVANAEDELQKMAEAELPFLKSGDQKDMDELIGEADTIASQVYTAIAEAQTFIARKLVEVARFSEGPAKTVKEEIDMMQKRLEDGRDRLQQFKAGIADRKRTHLLEEVESKVKAAEDEVIRMAEATKGLNAVGVAGDLASDAAKESVDQANLAERSAQTCLVVARKHLTQKTQDLKKLAVVGAGSGAELGRLQTRVNNIQQEVTKLRNITKEAEQRLEVKTMLAEVAERLSVTEADVDKVAAVAVAVRADEQPSPEQVEKMEHATNTAQKKLSATSKLIDVKLKSSSGVLKEELTAMRKKITAAEKKLATVMQAAREQKERLMCTEIVSEASEFVDKAETEVTKTGEAELPFLKGVESLPAAEASAAVDASEAAAAVAQKAIAAARTYVVQKLVEVREYSQGPSDSCSKELGDLQKRLDAGASKLNDLKKDTAERKRTTQMQASGQMVSKVEEAIQKLASTMKKFPEEETNALSSEKARVICEEIGAAESEAQASVTSARQFLAQRLQDAKSSKDFGRAAGVDLAKLQGRLTQCQVELAKLSKQCTEREQRFVAQKLVQESNEHMAKLRQEIELATSVAQELVGDDKSSLLESTFVNTVAAGLLAHIQKTGSSAEKVFESVAGAKKTVPVTEVGKWLQGLSESVGAEDVALTDERASKVAALISSPKGMTVACLKAFLRERYVVSSKTDASDKKDGKPTCSVEVGEGLRLLEPIADGAAHGHFELLRDGSKVYAALEGLKAGPPFNGRLESIEALVKSVHQRCTEAAQAIDQRTVDLAHVKSGPLLEVKSKLQEVRTALGTERAKVDALRKRCAASRTELLQQQKEEVHKVAEAKCKAFAVRVITEGTAAVKAAEEKLVTILESAKAGSAEKLQKDLSITELDKLKVQADEALSTITEAKAVVAKQQEAHEGFKGSKNLLLESRVELAKLSSRASTAERKLKGATEAVRTAHTNVVKAATKRAAQALRAASRESGKSTDEMFDSVSGGKGEITEKQFSSFVKGLPKQDGLDAEQAVLVFKEFGKHGLRKPGFAKMLQEFYVCEKATEITKDLSANSSVVRRLERTELVEVLEGPSDDGESKRVRGRALRDGTTGWVTFSVGSAAPLMRPREKPFLCAILGAPLYQENGAESKEVRQIQQDEVLELLEGPRPREVPSELVLHCSASKDGRVGWMTIRDAKGKELAVPSKNLYVCKSAIAMTDNADIKAGKVIRKVDVGEALEVVGGQDQADDKGISRLEFRAVRDGKQGWVSLKGNMGTTYVQLSDSHYEAVEKITLTIGPSRDSQVIRTVEAGEKVQAKEPAKEVKPETKMIAKTRSLEDGKVGWVAFAPGPKAPVKPWKNKYVCKVPVDITVSLALQKGTAAVRQADRGQIFMAVDAPSLDSISGKRRVCLSTAEDGVVGWATLRADDGKAFMEVA